MGEEKFKATFVNKELSFIVNRKYRNWPIDGGGNGIKRIINFLCCVVFCF